MDTSRYEIQAFKPTSAKRVPYEELDFSVYKATANTVAFSTCETRMPLWIRVLKIRYQNGLETNVNIKSTWDEINNTNDESRWEKVCINLMSRENSTNLVTIAAFITTGRIHIQGRNVREWGSEEFPALIEMINNNTDSDQKPNLDTFINKIFSSKIETKTLNSSVISDSNNPTPKEKSSTTMKNSLASLEADFVQFKQETNKTIDNLMELNHYKDQEIKNLKRDILSYPN